MINTYKKIAAKLISLKSVSANKKECKKTASYLFDLFFSYGFETKLLTTKGNPVVYAKYVTDKKFETCLIYGHYDVQDAKRAEGWNSDPFSLVEKNERLYGRGIMDDKCQFLIHILTIGELIKQKKLGVNIIFLLEGNEEEGSPFIEQCVKDNKDLLICDFIVISDGEMTKGKPTIELGNRGVINWTIQIKTAESEIHSGMYGGAAPNAVHELSNFLSTTVDKNNHITIDGFYDAVDAIDKEYDISFDEEAYKKNTGTKGVITEKGFSFYTQTGLRPSLSVIGMYGGHTDEGYRTAIPAFATAKINMRLVMSQTVKESISLIKKHVAKHMPTYVDYELTFDQYADPNKTDKDNRFVQRAKKLLEEVYKTSVLYRYVGGTEPVVLYFQQILNKPIVSIPFANEDGFMHGANENFKIDNIKQGLAFSKKFFTLQE